LGRLRTFVGGLDTWQGTVGLLVVGLAIRLVLAPFIGFHGDLQLFQQWAIRLDQVGPGEFYAPELFADYPPGYLYVLWFLGELSAAPGYVLLKLPAIVGDLGLALVAATLAVRIQPRITGLPARPVVLAAVLLNPAVFGLSAGWGQVDAIPAAFVVGALLLLLTGRRSTWRDIGALASFAVAMAIKPQAAVVFPVLLYALYRHHLQHRRGQDLARGALRIGAIGAASFAVWASFGPAFGLGPTELVRFYADASSVYQVTSAWAFNLWGAVGFFRDDVSGPLLTSFLGIPAFHVGMLLLVAGLVYVMWRSHRAIEHGAPYATVLCVAAASASLIGYAVLTRMHERYLFTSIALLAPLIGWRFLRRGYIALSVLFLLNLWYPLAYFNTGWEVPTLRVEPVFGWLFGPIFTTDTWQKTVLSIVVAGTCLFVALRSVSRLDLSDSAARSPRIDWNRWAPPLAVAAVCAFNLIVLRGEATFAPNLNDSAFHLQMVRWATARLDDGRIALDSWFPYLSLGSAHFHHYQSLPHTLTALVSDVFRVDPTTVYLWLQYLLLALWPVSVYFGTRLLGWSKWVAASAAVLSPVVLSASGYGIEQSSYTWRGLGVYSQLWGMVLLPIALGFAWQAITKGRWFARAIVAMGLLIAMHFLTAYLGLIVVGVWGLLAVRGIVPRLVRTAIVLGGALVAAAWVLVPLLADRSWSSQSAFYEDTIFRDSFGARKVLAWMISGELLDQGRFPALTLLAAVGLGVCGFHARRSESARAVLAGAGVSLVLFFGRPTPIVGDLIDALPGSGDLQVHRFVMGVQLFGLLLAAIGLVEVVTVVMRYVPRYVPARVAGWSGAAVAGVLVALLLLPPLDTQADYNADGAALIRAQRASERSDGADLQGLIDIVAARGDGRAYAGLRGNWGADYAVGSVPVHVALTNADVDSIGFAFRVLSSLSTDIEALFDETNPAHYEMMNVKYLILPSDRAPSVPASLIASSGRHRLYEVDTTGYFQVADRVGNLEADRTNIAAASEAFLASSLASESTYYGIAFDGRDGPPPTVDRVQVEPPGRVGSSIALPLEGRYAATVVAERPSTVVLKVSYHPRWRVTVDGEPASTVMMSPSLLGVDVPAGEHDIVFRYEPYPDYTLLLSIGVVVVLAAAIVPRVLAARRRASREATTATGSSL
jgi:Gpi18-like mannosyltransferase